MTTKGISNGALCMKLRGILHSDFWKPKKYVFSNANDNDDVALNITFEVKFQATC